MKKVKIQSRVSPLMCSFLLLVFFAVVAFIIYILFFSEFVSAKTKSRGFELLFLVVFILPIIFRSLLNNEIYPSEFIFYDDYFEIIYKKKNKEAYRRKIYNNDIEKFDLNANIEFSNTGKSRFTICTSNALIKLKNNEEVIINQDSTDKFFGSPYQYIFDLLSVSSQIPNFHYQITGNNDFAKAEIDYFIRFSKRMPFFIRLKISMDNTPISAKIVLGICVLSFLASIIFLIFLNLPAPKLNEVESKFMLHYKKASNLRIDIKDYYGALEQLEEAQKYDDKNPELYIEKSYNYAKLEEYEKALLSAKEGLKYVNNTKSPYRKYYNFKFIGKDDIQLYSLIAINAKKLGKYNEAIEAYSYIIKHNHYKYQETYLKRGICYYYKGDLENARKDFLVHKDIILKYFDDQSKSEYKDKYPRFDNKDLNKVEKWILTVS